MRREMRRPATAPRGAAARAPRAADRSDDAEITVGLRAGLALLAARPADVVSLAHGPLPREAEGPVREARAAGVDVRAFDEREAARELARLTGTEHHEGFAVLAAPRRFASAAEVAERLVSRRGIAVALDRVRNPYNVGSILRTAAFFGVDAVVLGAPAPHPALALDAVRVAEGGAERVLLSRTTDLAQTLATLAARGARAFAAESERPDGRAPEGALGYRFPRPAVLVVGHEREGVADRVRAACERSVTIRGSGAVESLNVSIATAILVAELARSGA